MAINYDLLVQEGLQKQGPTAIDYNELTKSLKPTKLRFATSKAGKKFVQLVNSQDQHLSLGIGANCVLTSTKDLDILDELVKDYIIYTDVTVTRNGRTRRWFTFGIPAQLPESREYDYTKYTSMVSAG